MNIKQADKRPERSFAGRLEVKKAVATEGAAAVVPADGTFATIASAFNEPHPTSAYYWLPPDWMDVIDPGAFNRTLADKKKSGGRVQMYWNHDRSQKPIGKWDSISVGKDGLEAKGHFLLKTALGAEIYELVLGDAVYGCSIGFEPVEYELDEKKKVRTLTDIELIEISPVDIPGDPGALITDVKAKFDPTNIREIEDALREAGFSREEAKRILAGGFKALTSPRDADEEKDQRTQQAFEKLMKTLTGK